MASSNNSVGIADDLKAYLNKSGKSVPSTSSSRENLVSVEPSANSLGSWFSKNFSSSPPPDNHASSSSSTFWFQSGTGDDDPGAAWFSRKQRLLGFVLCLAGGVVCFGMASLYLPVLLLKARKFALLFTLGSIFVISSFSFLWGFTAHMRHLFSRERWIFTCAYFGTLALTVYFALGLRSTALTVVSSILQIVALIWYIVSYLPGGQKGLSFFSKLFYRTASKTVTSTLNV